MCHLILLMPLAGLAAFWVLPFSIALPVYLVILVPSGWLYWYVMRSIYWPVQTGVEHLHHAKGKVVTVDGRHFTVFVNGEHWNARSSDALGVGDDVEVIDVKGLELTVRCIEPSPEQHWRTL